MSSQYLSQPAFDVIYDLTCVGKCSLQDRHVESMEFATSSGKVIKIKAKRFVIACGGIESTRLVLLMLPLLRDRLQSNSENVGAYIMDHPKVNHGNVELNCEVNDFKDYQLKFFNNGRTKLGIKRAINGIRIYSNINHKKNKLVEKVYARSAGSLYAFF